VNFNLKGKRALVTGASRGIGEAIAVSLAGEGATVAVTARTDDALAGVLAAIGGRANGHTAVAVDLATDEGPGRLIAELRRGFGVPDVVVHNLGGSLEIRDPFCPLEDWRKVFRLNLEVGIALNNLVVPDMKARGWGRIVHVSSVSGLENVGAITYCAAKAALNAYTKGLGRILAPDGIVVCAVCPGMVLAPGGPWDRATKERPDYVKKMLEERMPTQRFARTEEIADVVTFLCSEQASQCAGSVISVDGGMGRAFSC
jgi:NAD(P)-dependent dehydrogenase (short-subunit alcohol dehydrogenase family)